jgi:hypothetical protein
METCYFCKITGHYAWQQLIIESDSLFKEKLGFILFFQPKSKKEMEFLFILRQ